MNVPPASCDLCGLPLRYGQVPLRQGDRQTNFCCQGCRQVFIMLSEATEATDPANFRQTDLFRRCVEAGIVPRSEEDLAAASDRGRSSPSAAEDPAAFRTVPEGCLPLHLVIDGMWCPACAWVIEETLRRQPGLDSARCHFATDRLRCTYDPTRIAPDEIQRLIERLGYRARAPETSDSDRQRHRFFVRFGVSAFMTMNVMMLSFALYSGFFTALDADDVWKISWPLFCMATVVMIYAGRPLFRKALAGMISGQPGMEALVSIGAWSAYGYSLFNLLRGSIHLYFDTACMLILLVLLGKLLERRAKDRIQADLGHYYALMPAKVRLCRGSADRGRYVAAAQLAAGDLFRVVEGEVVAADGQVLEGRGLVDASSLTGEARPQARTSGDRLASGMRVAEGAFLVCAERAGQDSTLGQMIAIMDAALSRRTTVETWTDRILRGFVPGIILLAVATAVVLLVQGAGFEAAFIRGLTVLVISCPCALGLAVPLARVAGVTLAARRGILVQDITAFDKVERIDTVVFDKTGTLTQGRWRLQSILAPAQLGETDILALAAGLEQGIDHPTAAAIRKAAHERHIDALPVSARTPHARGVTGLWQGRTVHVGQCDPNTTDDRYRLDPGLHSANKSPLPMSWVCLSVDGETVGRLGFGDRLKPGAPEAVARLQAEGLDVVLVSGDGQAATEAVGTRLGIAKVRGAQLPVDKARIIETLRREGRRVAMVGDGVNDAPALASADLSVALYAGRQLGAEAQAVTLMEGDPLRLHAFLRFAKQVNRKIEQNLWGSLVYNLVSIPIAMVGWLSPLVAVAAMLLSSLSVTGNTLLLIRGENRSASRAPSGGGSTTLAVKGADQ